MRCLKIVLTVALGCAPATVLAQALSPAQALEPAQAAVGGDAGDGRVLIEQARRLILEGRHDDARAMLERALESDRSNPDAWRLLARVADAGGRRDAAVDALEEAVALAPEDRDLALELGRAYERADRLDDAVATYRALAEADETFAEAWFRLGRLHSGAGRVQAAIDAFERVLAQGASAPDLATESATDLDRLYATRARELTDALRSGEADPGEALGFGRVLIARGRPAQARDLFDALVERTPEDPQAHYWLARVLIATREFEAGIESLARSVSLAGEPLASRLKLELGKAYEFTGDPANAERVFGEIAAEAREADVVADARRRGDRLRATRLAEEDPGAALALYDELVAAAPDDLRLAEARADVLEALGRHDEADRVYLDLLRREPDDISLHMRVAATWDERGEGERARPLYTRVLALDPPSEVARVALDGLGLGAGVERLQQGDAEEALAIFRSILEVVDDAAPVVLAAGLAERQLGQLDAAEASFERVLQLEPGNDVATLELAQIYEQSGRFAEAIDLFEEIERTAVVPEQSQLIGQRLIGLYAREVERLLEPLRRGEPEAVEAATGLASTLVDRGFYRDAIGLIEPALERAPAEPRLHFDLGRAYIGMDQGQRGIASIRRAVELDPADLGLREGLAQAYQQVGRLEDAERTLGDLIARTADEERLATYTRALGLTRARRLLEGNDVEGALAEYDRLVENHPDETEFAFERARLLMVLGRGEEADAAFERILADAPANARLRIRVADLYREQGRMEEVERLLREAAELDPANLTLRLQLARHYEQMQRFDDALPEYDVVLAEIERADPSDPRAAQLVENITRQITQRGTQFLAQGNLDEAEALFSRLVEARPDHAQSLFWLAEVYGARGDHARQSEAMERVVELSPGNIVMQRRLAIALDSADRRDDAREALGQVLEAFPYDSEIRYRLADVEARSGDDAAARSELTRLLELNPSEEWRMRALDRLGLERARELEERGEIAAALEAAEGVRAIAPADPLVITTAARLERQAGRLEAAEASYRAALEIAPGDPQARLGLARLYTDSGREDLAIAGYRAILTETPAAPEAQQAREGLGELMLRRAQRLVGDAQAGAEGPSAQDLLSEAIEMHGLEAWAGAAVLLEHLVTAEPDSAAANHWLGRVYAELERPADSLVFLRRATEIEPDRPAYLRSLAGAYEGAKLDGLARETLDRALAADPDDVETRFQLAGLHERRGDDEAARAQYAHILQRTADPVAARRAIAGLGLGVNPDRLDGPALAEAQRVFDQLIPGLPAAPVAQLYRAIVLHRLQYYTQAEAAYRALIAAAPEPEATVGAGTRLSMLLAETGRIEEAIELLEGIAGLQVRDPRMLGEAQQRLTELYMNRAVRLIEPLRAGEGDIDEARRIGRHLVERGAWDVAATMLDAAIEQAPDDAQLQYWLGRAHVGAGRTGVGLPAIARSVELAPENDTLRQHLGVAYEQAGRLKEAETTYRDLARRAGSTEAREEALASMGRVRARLLTDAGEFEAALAEYDALLRRTPDDPLLIAERGRLLDRLGRGEEADRAYQRVLEIAPGNVDARMLLADAFRARRDLPAFLSQLSAVVTLEPASPQAARARGLLGFDQGLALMQQESWSEAAEVFARMLDVIPNDPETLVQLAEALARERRFADAERILIGVVETTPHQRAYLLLGRISQQLDRRASAMQAYERAVALGTGTPAGDQAFEALVQLYAQRSQELINEGRNEAALQNLTRMVEIAPDNIGARISLSVIYLRLERYEEALRELQAAAALAPDAAIYARQGAIYNALEDYPRAMEAYAYAVALETDSARANEYVRDLLMAVARHQLSEERTFAAIRNLRLLNEQGIGNESSNFLLGVLYRQQQRTPEAMAAFRDAISYAPNNVIMRYNLADLYERNNDHDLALLQYREIMRVGKPGDRFVEEARRRANFMRNRLALFTQQLSYSVTIGDSNVEEQDINNTGAINTSFNSQLMYNLATNFWPANNLNLRLDTGVIYISNHSTREDNLVPRVGISSSLNFPTHFYNASAHASEIRDLMRDFSEGRSYTANFSAGLRFRDPFALFRGWRAERKPEYGEPEMKRAPEPRAPEAAAPNPRLRAELRRLYRQHYQPLRSAPAALVFPLAGGEDGGAPVPFAPGPEDPGVLLPGDLRALEPLPEVAAIGTAPDLPATGEALEREQHIEGATQAAMDLYYSGELLLRQGRLDEAAGRFEALLDVAPGDPLTLMYLAETRRRQGRMADAERALDAALRGDPGNVALRLRVASFYEATGRLDAAVDVLHAALGDAEGAEREQARDRLRALHARIADGLLAQETFGTGEAGRVVEAADALLALGDAAVAERILDEAIARRPLEARAHHLLARVRLEQGRPSGALAPAREALTLAPESDPRWGAYQLTLARVQWALGEFGAAENAYELLLGLAAEPRAVPGDGEVRTDLVPVARRELALTRAERREAGGDVEGALAIYHDLLFDHPTDVGVLRRAAEASAALGRTEAAAELYARAVDAQPDEIAHRLRLAELYRDLRAPDERRAQLSAAMAAARDEDERQRVRDELGFQQAIADIRAGRTTRALRTLEAMEAVAPEDPLVHINIGAVHHVEDRLLQAEASFQRALDLDPRNLTARLRLAMVHVDMNRADRAIALLEQVIAGAGEGSPLAARAAARLREVEQSRLRTIAEGPIERTEPQMKLLTGRLFFNDSSLPVEAITETYAYGGGLSFTYQSVRRGDWTLTYTYGVRDNENPLGTDYAYDWHDFGVSWRTSVPNFRGWFGDTENVPGLTGIVSYSREMRRYTYVDTNALNVLGEARYRDHTTDTLTLGLNYQVPRHEQMFFFASYTLGRARSNLPVGITFSPDGLPLAFQSSGLGDFDPNFFSLGMSFQF